MTELKVFRATPCGKTLAERSEAWKISQIIDVWQSVFYRFSAHKSAKKELYYPSTVIIGCHEILEENVIEDAFAVAEGQRHAKELINWRAKTPCELATYAEEMMRDLPSVKVKILRQPELEELGMGGLLAVGRGAGEEDGPVLIEGTYNGRSSSDSEMVFIGKGVCYDSGGYSMKPTDSMMDMHYDMGGAATVLGLLHVVASLQLSINIRVIIPAVLNLIGPGAYKPGDIYTNIMGETVDVVNTDAEGRIILADAMGYALKYKQKEAAIMIDVATLTGAISIALGSHRTGIFSNDENFAELMHQAGEETTDRNWVLPLDDEAYGSRLSEGTPADYKNHDGREAGATMAALFLYRMAKKMSVPWIHLDIAGTVVDRKTKEATGRPIPSLFEFIQRCT